MDHVRRSFLAAEDRSEVPEARSWAHPEGHGDVPWGPSDLDVDHERRSFLAAGDRLVVRDGRLPGLRDHSEADLSHGGGVLLRVLGRQILGRVHCARHDQDWVD